MIDLNLDGRRALVTGASKGIGEATVKSLADYGAAVTFCARNKEAVEQLASYQPAQGNGSVTGLIADMADKASVESFLDQVEAEGGIDILINNVGASPSRNFLHMSDEDWDEGFELNFMSAVRCTRRLLPHMRGQKWGRVVMIATGAAFYPGAALIDYAASKAAMIATAKALSTKYARDNVLVNSILPGLIRTDMWERAAGEIAAAQGIEAEDVFAANSKGVPLGRYGTADEIAGTIVFLCSEAAGYITGNAMQIDGGISAHV